MGYLDIRGCMAHLSTVYENKHKNCCRNVAVRGLILCTEQRWGKHICACAYKHLSTSMEVHCLKHKCLDNYHGIIGID